MGNKRQLKLGIALAIGAPIGLAVATLLFVQPGAISNGHVDAWRGYAFFASMVLSLASWIVLIGGLVILVSYLIDAVRSRLRSSPGNGGWSHDLADVLFRRGALNKVVAFLVLIGAWPHNVLLPVDLLSFSPGVLSPGGLWSTYGAWLLGLLAALNLVFLANPQVMAMILIAAGILIELTTVSVGGGFLLLVAALVALYSDRRRPAIPRNSAMPRRSRL